MNNETAQGSAGPPKMSIDDLLKLYFAQAAVCAATIELLEQAKQDQQELDFYRDREVRNLEQIVTTQNTGEKQNDNV